MRIQKCMQLTSSNEYTKLRAYGKILYLHYNDAKRKIVKILYRHNTTP